MKGRERSLVVLAVAVRVFVVVLGLVAGHIFPHYDRSGGSPFAQWCIRNPWIFYLTFYRDSVFYIDIAQHSYRFEQQFAFQPFLPLSIRCLSSCKVNCQSD
jgi:hypothetical protein